MSSEMAGTTSPVDTCTDPQPVEAGSKRKTEYLAKATPIILNATKTFKEDLDKLQNMKVEYLNACNEMKRKYPEKPEDILPEEISKLNDDQGGLERNASKYARGEEGEKHKDAFDYSVAQEYYHIEAWKLFNYYPMSRVEAHFRLSGPTWYHVSE